MASAASKKRKPPSVTNQILAVCKEHDGQGGVAQKVLESRLAANDVKSAEMLTALAHLHSVSLAAGQRTASGWPCRRHQRAPSPPSSLGLRLSLSRH